MPPLHPLPPPRAALPVDLQLALESRACTCQQPCSLASLMAQGLIVAGESVLSCCFRGELLFADLAADGRIHALASDSTTLTLASPCSLMHLVRLRMDSLDPPKAHAHKEVCYKGVQLGMVRPPPSRRRAGSLGQH